MEWILTGAGFKREKILFRFTNGKVNNEQSNRKNLKQ